MRIIAFINDACAVRDILTPIGEPTSPPRLMPARAPPLWKMPGATLGEDDPQAQSAPEYEFDQRIACEVRDRSQTSCHRPSWDDSRQGPSAWPVRPVGWPLALSGAGFG